MLDFTHIATNKKTGKSLKVEYDPTTESYAHSRFIAIKEPEKYWDIVPIKKEAK